MLEILPLICSLVNPWRKNAGISSIESMLNSAWNRRRKADRRRLHRPLRMPFMRGVDGLMGGGGGSNPVAVPDLDGKFAAVLVRPVNLNDLWLWTVMSTWPNLMPLSESAILRMSFSLMGSPFVVSCFCTMVILRFKFSSLSVKVHSVKPVYFERPIGSRTPLG